MNDNANNQPAAPTAPADNNPATPAVKPQDTNPGTAEFDPSSLSDEQFGKVFEDKRLFKHERFKSLNDRAKKADEYEKAQADAEANKLAEEGKYKELADQKAKEAEDAKNALQQANVKFALMSELGKYKVVDQDAALKLVDMSLVEVDKDGNITGADKAIEKLKSEKSYLFGEGSQTLGDNGANPEDDNSGVKTFKRSQLQDPKFYKENREDILKAFRAGKIIDDITPRA